MTTWAHALINTTIAKATTRAGHKPAYGAVILGGILPDLPLYVLSAWYFATRTPAFDAGYDELFFGNPLWIISHNMLHAPFVLVTIAALAFALRQRYPRTAERIWWFSASAMLHFALDLVTHTYDGPLVLFPFNLSFRVSAPVSYWDPSQGGAWFQPLELALSIGLAGYWVYRWWQRRRIATEQEFIG